MKSDDIILFTFVSTGMFLFFRHFRQEPAKKAIECDRDEAIGAKAIAEKKMADKDFAGAKKYILKAQSHDPELDGISQMLTTVNVYVSFENKVNGEPDWYGVLDVNPSDDEEAIKKQYKKLALVVHPDKNKSEGADDAFKILSEAWSLLSDKAKRTAYNERRNRTPPAPPGPVAHGNDTFWTVCEQCKMHHEYPRVDVNRTLVCPKCRKDFHAVEVFPDPFIVSLENLQLVLEQSTIATKEHIALFVELLNWIKRYVEYSQRNNPKRRQSIS